MKIKKKKMIKIKKNKSLNFICFNSYNNIVIYNKIIFNYYNQIKNK